MTRAKPPEKILAVVGIYKALATELGMDGWESMNGAVTAQLLATATQIAMASDTTDMGIMSIPGTKITRVVDMKDIDAQH